MTLAKSTHAKAETTVPSFLQNGGFAGFILRRTDWIRNPLGQPEHGPFILQAILRVVLGSRQPMLVCWGSEYHILYNDSYAETFCLWPLDGLGAGLLDIWGDIRDVIEPLVRRVYGGKRSRKGDLALRVQKWSSNGSRLVCLKTAHQAIIRND